MAKTLTEIDPYNAFCWYLLSSIQYKNGNSLEALQNLEQGNMKENYQSHYEGRFKAIVKTAKLVGVEKLPASSNAFIEMLNYEFLALTRKMCEKPKSKDMAKECISMGEKIEFKSFTLVEKLYALTIQKTSYKSLGEAENAEHLATVKDRRKGYSEIYKIVYPLSYSQSEEVWLNYYRDLFEQGEITAMKNRAKAAGKQLSPSMN